MAEFDEVQFPTDIAYGSSGGPEFSTSIVELGSGHERRNQNWSQSRERWNVAYGVKEQEHLVTLAAFFYARRGRARGFRFKNHADFTATMEELTLIDETDDQFQIVKHYGPPSYEYVRTITKPVTGSVQVYKNDVLQSVGYTIDYTTGIITFSSPPSSVDVIEVSFEFDIPARFDVDYLPMRLETYLAAAADVTILELKPDD